MLSDIFFAGYGVTVIQGFQGASWPATSSRGRGSWWPGRRATSLRRWPRSKRPTRAASAPCLRSGSRDEIRRVCQSTMAPGPGPGPHYAFFEEQKELMRLLTLKLTSVFASQMALLRFFRYQFRPRRGFEPTSTQTRDM